MRSAWCQSHQRVHRGEDGGDGDDSPRVSSNIDHLVRLESASARLDGDVGAEVDSF